MRLLTKYFGTLLWKATTFSLFSLAVILAAVPETVLAGDKPSASNLQQYLEQVGYAGIALSAREKNKMLVEGKIRDRSCLFLVDTGCSMTTLDTRAARDLKTLGELGVVVEDRLRGRITNPSVVLVDKLSLGRAQFMNQPADVQALEMDYISAGQEGILGLDFCARNFVLIDCRLHRLYVRGSKPTEQQARAIEESLRQSGFVSVPISEGSVAHVEVQINNKPVRLVVDTGAHYTLLDEPLVSRLGLSFATHEKVGSLIPEETSTLIIGIGKIGAHKTKVATLKTFEVGGRQWKNTAVGVCDMKAWGDSALRADGFMGMDILAGHGALIDLASWRLWFAPK